MGRARTLAQVYRRFGEVDAAGTSPLYERVGIAYGDRRSLGDPASPVRMTASIVGERPVPARAMPEVVARVGVDLDPVDVTDADDARWLRACVWPDRPEQAARLQAEMALAATAPPLLIPGPPAGVAGGLLAVRITRARCRSIR